jgi:hypothetical protein
MKATRPRRPWLGCLFCTPNLAARSCCQVGGQSCVRRTPVSASAARAPRWRGGIHGYGMRPVRPRHGASRPLNGLLIFQTSHPPPLAGSTKVPATVIIALKKLRCSTFSHRGPAISRRALRENEPRIRGLAKCTASSGPPEEFVGICRPIVRGQEVHGTWPISDAEEACGLSLP